MRRALSAVVATLVLASCASEDMAERYVSDLAAIGVDRAADHGGLVRTGEAICDEHDVAQESDHVTHAEARDASLRLLRHQEVTDPELVYLLSLGSLCDEHWTDPRSFDQVRREAGLG